MTGILLVKPFSGSARGSVALDDMDVGGTKYAEFTMSFDGFTYRRNQAGAAVQMLPWISPQVGMADFDVRATYTGDPLNSNAGENVWLSLANSRTWGFVNQSTPKTGQLSLEIRLRETGVIVDTAIVNLNVWGTV